MKPIIGITSSSTTDPHKPWSPETFGQSATYAKTVIASGGVPVMLPITRDVDVLKTVFDKLDGILFAGGNDISPEHYNQDRYPETQHLNADRDFTELALFKIAMASDKPILGICRGAQLINVGLGGTLHQHIPKDVPGAHDHEKSSKEENPLDISQHIRIDTKSRLAKILGAPEIGTNSHHHQAVNKLGEGLQATAWAKDGVIEAIEIPNRPNLLGIQSHPESLTEVEPKWKRLFDSFVNSCKR